MNVSTNKILQKGVRFAPSPTGKFHLGNLRTAWISHAWARRLKTPWIVRFEDIDGPRVVTGAQEKQLADMKTLGLVPDEVLKQSDFHSRHLELFKKAAESGRLYPCACSRKEIQTELATLASAPHEPAPIYTGACREKRPASAGQVGWRFRSPNDETGAQDFLVARARLDFSEFTPSYHWACALDDAYGDYALLVRAWDLETATPQQRSLQEIIGRPAFSAVFHASMVVNSDGSRLEKRTQGVTLDECLATGLTAGKVIAAFEKSFDQNLFKSFAPGKVWGEKKRELKIAERDLGTFRFDGA